jgi:competence protein ComEC
MFVLVSFYLFCSYNKAVKSYFVNWKVIVVTILIGFNILIWSVSPKKHQLLEVAFLNIGQGDAILITSPVGNQLLIDGGPDGSVLRELSKVMKLFDRKIDVMLASHPDRDHINGLPDVLERYEVKHFIHSGVTSTSQIDDALMEDIVKENAKIHLARRGMQVDLGGGVVGEILFPDRNPEGMDTNDASVILRLVYGSNCFLFTGDSSTKIEQYLVEMYDNKIQCDVLKVGHHGSRTSTGAEFLHFVKPSIGVISAGKGNSYGHPHAEVIKNLQDASTTVFSTIEMGIITILSDGNKIWRK